MRKSYLALACELKPGDVLVELKRHHIQVEEVEWIGHNRVRIFWHHPEYPGISGDTEQNADNRIRVSV